MRLGEFSDLHPVNHGDAIGEHEHGFGCGCLDALKGIIHFCPRRERDVRQPNTERVCRLLSGFVLRRLSWVVLLRKDRERSKVGRSSRIS